MAGLLQLPNELLAIIFEGLDAPSFFALRLTSKHTHSATLPAFTRQYFTTRYVMFSRLSLQNLVDIARHPDFGPAVRKLEFCTDHFHRFYSYLKQHEGDRLLAIQENRFPPAVLVDNLLDVCSSGEEEEGQSPGEEGRSTDEGGVSSQDSYEAPVNKVAYKSLWEEQELIIMPGLAQAYITQALIALPNVEAILISSEHRPWGLSAHRRQTGLPPMATDALAQFQSAPFAARLLHIVLTAIATSGTALDMFAMKASLYRRAITPDHLRPSEAHLQCYKSLPSSLTKLILKVCDGGRGNLEFRWADDLLAFIGVFRQLTQLDLDIEPNYLGPMVDRLKELAPKLQIPRLQSLGLYRAYCNVSDLETLISRHRTTLESVTLARVVVSGGIGHWIFLFTMIREHIPRLVLSIKSCAAGGLALVYRVEQEDGEAFKDTFDVGGNRENWTKAIHAIEARDSGWKEERAK
ncbi:hypothetical protein GGR54DRAFT_291945 [Hypoxylon sp. NC1633]|nr:hypothetical protein GGR54DRAFT_291945 [Hypoxylon sp. NC1633]